MSSEIKQQVVKGTFWALFERFSTQIVSFIVSMVLARLLTPTDYGTVALLTIFIAIAGVLADSGFGLALIQKKEVTELDYNSVFYCGLVVSVILYLILFFAAPWIADFYEVPVLIPILRVQAFTLILNSINSIQNAEIARELKFNLSFKVSLISTFTSAVLGIGLAYLGYGVWALVWSQFLSGVVGTISKWFIVKWHPKLMFSFSALKPLFSFGWKMVFVNLIYAVYSNLYGILVGKMYSKEDLAFFNKGQNQPNIIMNSVEGTLGRVSLPTFSKFQNDKEKMVNAMRKMLICSTFFVFPLMTILGFTAYGQVKLMYGDQWLPTVPYIQLFCFQMAFMPFANMNLQAIAALGRTDLSLKIEIVKDFIGILIVIIAAQFSVMVLVLGLVFVFAPIALIVNSWFNRKLFNYPIEKQLHDVAPAAGVCLLSGIGMYSITLLNLHYIPELIFQCFTGAIVYLVCASVFRIQGLQEVLSILGGALINRLPKCVQSRASGLYDYVMSNRQ